MLLGDFRYEDNLRPGLLALRVHLEKAIELAATAKDLPKGERGPLWDIRTFLRGKLPALDVVTETAPVRDGHAIRAVVPLRFDLIPTTYETALALATVEYVSGARWSGLCPHCHHWWMSNDDRRRNATTCGRDQCKTDRIAEWHKANRPSGYSTKYMRAKRKRDSAKARRPKK